MLELVLTTIAESFFSFNPIYYNQKHKEAKVE